VSRILRFLGFDATDDSPGGSPALASIEARLGALEPDRARFFACFAYLLARVADADLEVEDRERAAMADVLARHAGLSEHDAAMVAELALMQAEELGSSAHYEVARRFRDISQPAERLQLVECLFAVAGADETVSLAEGNEVMQIGDELGIDRRDMLAIRSRHRDRLAEFRKLRGER
jgi:uncharacterized tellurite resistance protein B-like protein